MSLHIRQQAIAEAEAEHSSSDAETHHSSDDEEDIPRPLRFSAECPLLPPSRSIDFPHIIQISDYDPAADLRDLTFPDIIATFLWHWDRVQFYKFFDMSRNHFELHYRAPRASGRDMVISRNGRGVMAGFRVPDGYGGMEWDPQLVYSIESDWRWVGRMCSEGMRREVVEAIGTEFARVVLRCRLWEARDGGEVTVYHD